MVIDRADYRASNLRGQGDIANGPFPPGSVGYVEDSGYPEPDLEAAKALIAEYEAEKGEIGTITFTATSDAFNQQTAIFVQQALSQLDITVAMATVQQSELVSTAIAGSYEMMPFRFYGGGIPDYNLIWWYTGGPTNFPRIADPEIDRLMDEGRGTADPEAQAEIYEAGQPPVRRERLDPPPQLGDLDDRIAADGPRLHPRDLPDPALRRRCRLVDRPHLGSPAARHLGRRLTAGHRRPPHPSPSLTWPTAALTHGSRRPSCVRARAPRRRGTGCTSPHTGLTCDDDPTHAEPGGLLTPRQPPSRFPRRPAG